MIVEALAGCCNAVVVHGFGGSANAQRRIYGEDVDPTLKEQREFVLDCIADHGKKLIIATTTDEQTDTNKMLKAEGFQRTKSMNKIRHSESKLIMWWRRPGGTNG
jgi:hypothetical protein